MNSALDDIIADCTAELAAEDALQLRKGDIEEGLDRESAWVKTLGWVRHFASRDKLSIYEAVEWVKAPAASGRAASAADEETLRMRARLVRLAQSFDREVDRCCWRLDSVPTETLQWLASIALTAPSRAPFGLKGQEASMKKYRLVGQRYIGFCLRAYYAGRDEAFKQWAISFTDEQWSLLGDVVYELEALESHSSQDSGYHSHGRGGEESEDDEEDCDKANLPTIGLDRTVFLFFVASLKQHVGGRVYASPLLCFCAALGIRSVPIGYAEPYLYTGLLAAVLWWSRLFFLEAGFEAQPRGVEDVGAEAVLTFREELAKWMFVGTHTPISTILAWMAYGRGWRQQMSGQASVRWSEG